MGRWIIWKGDKVTGEVGSGENKYRQVEKMEEPSHLSTNRKPTFMHMATSVTNKPWQHTRVENMQEAARKIDNYDLKQSETTRKRKHES